MKQIKLTKGFFAVVDDEDFERVNAFKWHASIESRGTKVYAVRFDYSQGKRLKIRMHRFVLGLPPLARALQADDIVVDHDNGDGLDNRKENLIPRTQAENMLRVPTWKRKGEKAKGLDDEPWL